MSDTDRVQEWRKRLRQEGEALVTLWLSREEKRRLEALAKPWHCSTSDLVQQVLTAFPPGSPSMIAAIANTEPLRQLATATVTYIVTATLSPLVREIVEEMAHDQEQAAMSVTATGTSNETVTRTLRDMPARQPAPERYAVTIRAKQVTEFPDK